jgi:hypothetical protein
MVSADNASAHDQGFDGDNRSCRHRERIEKEQHGILRIFLMPTLPLLLIAAAIESYGLIT